MAGDEPGTRALIEQARAPTLETFDGDVVRRFFTNSAFVLHGFALYEEALAVALEGIDAETRAGTNPHGQLCVYENAAELMCLLGRPSEAAELLGDEDGAFTSDMIVMHITVAKIAMMRGELDAAGARLARARDGRDVDPMLLLMECTLQAEVALWRQDLATALEACSTGESLMVEHDQIPAAELLFAAVRTQVEAAEGGVLDGDAAVAEVDRLLARLEKVVMTDVRLPAPDAVLLTAIAERSRLDAEPDAGAWRAARDAWAAINRPYDTTYAELRLAQGLAVTHGPREELEQVLRDAHERAIRIEAAHLADAVEALARRTRVALPGVEGTDGSAFPDLTKREREVLALVADGRTNRQIAQELFITDKTASVHVSNILGKLGASNRGEAAALAHKAGFELTET